MMLFIPPDVEPVDPKAAEHARKRKRKEKRQKRWIKLRHIMLPAIGAFTLVGGVCGGMVGGALAMPWTGLLGGSAIGAAVALIWMIYE